MAFIMDCTSCGRVLDIILCTCSMLSDISQYWIRPLYTYWYWSCFSDFYVYCIHVELCMGGGGGGGKMHINCIRGMKCICTHSNHVYIPHGTHCNLYTYCFNTRQEMFSSCSCRHVGTHVSIPLVYICLCMCHSLCMCGCAIPLHLYSASYIVAI